MTNNGKYNKMELYIYIYNIYIQAILYVYT